MNEGHDTVGAGAAVICAHPLLELGSGATVLCGLSPHGIDVEHAPGVIDVRTAAHLYLLQKCTDCGKEVLCHLICRHTCGCYLDPPKPVQTPLWRKIRRVRRWIANF